MAIEIKNRWTNRVIYTLDADTLSRADLSGADLSGADLSRADLSGANLSRADLYGADLSGANLSRADLYGADLYGADLSRADLSRANLYGANLSRADLYGANLYGADLSRANLSRADLSRANLYGANLSRADLYGANLYGADLSRANLYGANLYGADLSRANLYGVCGLTAANNLDKALNNPLTLANTVSVNELKKAGFEIQGQYVIGYRTKYPQHYGNKDKAYAVGKTYKADFFDPNPYNVCSFGLYIAPLAWMKNNYGTKKLIKVRADLCGILKAGDKYRVPSFKVLENVID